MNRHHKLLQTEEIYTELIDSIKSAVKGIQEQVIPIKQFLGDHRKEIIKLSRTEKWMDDSLEFVQLFYDNTFKELISIERICEECLVRLNTNLLTATKGRAQPPSYLSAKEMRKIYKMCRDAFNETKENELSCLCTWENKPTWDLDDTQDILIKPKEMALTEFDEYDLKFIQEIVYLRTRMFSLPKKRIDVKSGHDILRDTANGKHRTSIRLSLNTADFLQLLKQREVQQGFSYEDELSKLKSLTFVDGKFKTNDTWLKILDVQGVLYGSLWHLALCPQIEKILTKRLVPKLRLNPRATFDFLSKITNFASFVLSRTDLITLLKHEKDAIWLKSWKNQFMAIDGRHVAATLIQAFWRGSWDNIQNA